MALFEGKKPTFSQQIKTTITTAEESLRIEQEYGSVTWKIYKGAARNESLELYKNQLKELYDAIGVILVKEELK